MVGYYLDANVCTKVTAVKSCILYNSTEDKCEECKLGLFLNTETNLCEKFTVKGCLKGTSVDVCTECKSSVPNEAGDLC